MPKKHGGSRSFFMYAGFYLQTGLPKTVVSKLVVPKGKPKSQSMIMRMAVLVQSSCASNVNDNTHPVLPVRTASCSANQAN